MPITNSLNDQHYGSVRNTDLETNTWQDIANAFIAGYGPATMPVLQWNRFVYVLPAITMGYGTVGESNGPEVFDQRLKHRARRNLPGHEIL